MQSLSSSNNYCNYNIHVNDFCEILLEIKRQNTKFYIKTRVFCLFIYENIIYCSDFRLAKNAGYDTSTHWLSKISVSPPAISPAIEKAIAIR